MTPITKIARLIVLLLSLTFSTKLVAHQEKIWNRIHAAKGDKERFEIIIKDGVDIIYENPEKLPQLIALCITLGKTLQDERGNIVAQNLKGVLYRINGKADSALMEHTTALELLRKGKHPELLASTYNYIGIVYKSKNDLSKHLEYLDSGLNVCRQYKLTKLQNRYLMNKAYLIFQMGKKEEAIQISLNVINQFNTPDDVGDKCVALNNLGIFYRMSGSYDSAINCCLEAAKYALQQNFSLYLADAWCELGYLEQIKGKEKQAFSYISAADSIYSLTDDYLGRYRVITFKIAAYIKGKNYKQALYFVNELITIAHKFQNINWLSEAFKEKSTIEELQGNHALALQSMKQHMLWLDSFNTNSGNAKLAELEFKYQIRDKDKQLQILQKDAELHKQRQFLGYSIGVMLLLVISSIALYASVKAKSRKAMAERERQQLLFQLEAQKEEIQLKSRQLTSKALYISERNELLEELLKMTKEVGKKEVKGDLLTIERKIRTSLTNNKDWEEFKKYFEELNPDYLNRVKQLYPDLTERELRLLAFVKIGLNTKEIANILHVEPNSVKTARYRLKKKFNLDMDNSLEHFLNTI